METFKDLDSYYAVSDIGKIKSKRNGKILALHTDSKRKGYQYVTLSYNGIKKTRQVHRLVAKLFIPNPRNLPCINHKDENPSNNNVSNLEWCTYSYNLSYAGNRKRELETKRIKKCRNATKGVIQKDLNGKIINEFYSAGEAGKQLNIASTHIVDCCNKKVHHDSKGYCWTTKTAGGYVFSWKNEKTNNNNLKN